ncbi:flavodoxin [Lacticaseibacillus camelliae DSM 22697 = JCM 13995]|uniref:Flavodoxin n=1 Tax=Lacticaseibacillus camelliae DSM 22697 = JCM 13995 TaxID=1423730 RepID=A0A0R2EWC2_9LACO|nr:flavodoxin [Lacticaseibacillus camelliae DSM 22697 = JCM 13995]
MKEVDHLNKTLIAYYSWSGHTAALAERLHAQTHADLYEIKAPADTFSVDMYETADIAKAQLKAGQLPPLAEPLPDLSKYDTILVGGPVWSGAPATPVLSFLAAIPDDDVRLAPFYTDAGTPGDYEAVFKRAAGKHSIASALGLPGSKVATAQTQIQQWLNQL